MDFGDGDSFDVQKLRSKLKYLHRGGYWLPQWPVGWPLFTIALPFNRDKA